MNGDLAIKGTRDGLMVTLGTGEWADVLGELHTRLGEKAGFFEGARVIIQAGARYLTTADLNETQALLAQHNMTLWAVLSETEDTRVAARQLGLATRLGTSAVVPPPEEPAPAPAAATLPAFLRPAPELPESPEPPEAPPDAVAYEAEPPTTPVTAPGVPFIEDSVAGVLVRRTLRSGKSLRYTGAVVVLGDVNAGAEIVAGGDVIVWGKLRGVVHAGAMGDEQAVVCALEMAPTQLRIAGHIAIAPDERRRHRTAPPEAASVRNGQIIVEEWK